MLCNVGGIERVVRLLLGLALLGVAFFHVLTGALAILAYVLGGIASVTWLVGFCPVWAIFGINTCARKHAKAGDSGRQARLKDVAHQGEAVAVAHLTENLGNSASRAACVARGERPPDN
jgi:hypothetical protein